jgi:hypothetical protein
MPAEEESTSKAIPMPRPALAPVVQPDFEGVLVPEVAIVRVVVAGLEELVVEGRGGPVVLAGLRTLGFRVSHFLSVFVEGGKRRGSLVNHVHDPIAHKIIKGNNPRGIDIRIISLDRNSEVRAL